MTQKIVIQTNAAPAAIGAYSQAVKSGSLVFISGQIPLDPANGKVVTGTQAQIHRVFKNLAAVCEAAGGSLDDIVSLTVYMTDLSDFSFLNEIMAEYFNIPYPARAAVEVSNLPKGVSVEMQGILSLVRSDSEQ